MQHLKAYAVKGISKNDLKYECVDPRFKYVNKGSAMYVEWLGLMKIQMVQDGQQLRSMVIVL